MPTVSTDIDHCSDRQLIPSACITYSNSSSSSSSSSSSDSHRAPIPLPNPLPTPDAHVYLTLNHNSLLPHTPFSYPRTPLQPAPYLSSKTSNPVLLKRDDLNPVTFSIHTRALASWLLHHQPRAILPDPAHPLAPLLVPLCDRLSLPLSPLYPVLPDCTSLPRADLYLSAGYATCALELLNQLPLTRTATVFIPLEAGICWALGTYIKRIRPEITIVGIAWRCETKGVGADEVVDVTEEDVKEAITDLVKETRVVVDEAGAVAVAGLVKWARERGSGGETLVAVITSAWGGGFVNT